MEKTRKKQRNFTRQSILVLQSLGYEVENVEHYNAHTGRKNDMLGFADLYAFMPRADESILVQITDDGHLKNRLNKILNSAEAALFCSYKRLIWLMTWRDLEYSIKVINDSSFDPKILELARRAHYSRYRLAGMELKDSHYRLA